MSARAVWTERCAAACRAHPDVVAVYESVSEDWLAGLADRLVPRRPAWGLLLRHTLVPLAEERGEWLQQTRWAARSAIADLRAAGLAGGFLVLQWRPLPEVARVLAEWPCRHESDGPRHREVIRIVERRMADWRFVASHRPAPADLPEPADLAGLSGARLHGVHAGKSGDGAERLRAAGSPW